MNGRQHAIARIRAFFEPSTQFSSGIKIYEPKPGDPLASIKREIINFAVKAANSFESDKPYTRAETAALENKVNEYRASITDAEVSDYLKLLRAVEELAAADINSAMPSA